jgi:3-isopropylmalate dehydrogenase
MNNRYEIAVVPGDGIGPEVCSAAVTVLEAAFDGSSPFDYREYRAGAECYRDTGEAFPERTMDGCRKAAAILHGAAGLPGVLYPDGTEAGQDFSLRLRFTLDLYANVRPIRLYPGVESPLRDRRAGDIDYVIVRENTEGLYAARGGGNLLRDDVATDTMVMTRKGIERIVRHAAEVARRRNGAPLDGRRRVTVCDKSNVLRSFAFFRKVATETLAAYPDIEIDYVLVDAMCVHLVERPERFDVVVTENLIGDILSDLGAATIGGMGLSAAAEIGDGVGYFQASHGTAPDIAGKGVANPAATILSAAHMCEWLGERHADPAVRDAGKRIRAAVERALRDGGARTRDLGGTAGTAESTAAIRQALVSTG